MDAILKFISDGQATLCTARGRRKPHNGEGFWRARVGRWPLRPHHRFVWRNRFGCPALALRPLSLQTVLREVWDGQPPHGSTAAARQGAAQTSSESIGLALAGGHVPRGGSRAERRIQVNGWRALSKCGMVAAQQRPACPAFLLISGGSRPHLQDSCLPPPLVPPPHSGLVAPTRTCPPRRSRQGFVFLLQCRGERTAAGPTVTVWPGEFLSTRLPYFF